VKKTTAPYKYPRLIEFVTELPKTISDKIRRGQIREQDKYGLLKAPGGITWFYSPVASCGCVALPLYLSYEACETCIEPFGRPLRSG